MKIIKTAVRNKPMIVKVTRENIKAGKFGPYRCPVALALQKAAHDLEACVGANALHFRIEGKGKEMSNPSTVRRFIAAFDNWKTVKPFSFRIPSKYL